MATTFSEFMKKDDKRYFLDLKENSRGRFLRISQVVRYARQHVAFPAILLVELRNAINEVRKIFILQYNHKNYNFIKIIFSFSQNNILIYRKQNLI